jgi:ABC-2 type transport system ATP-binding protein
MSLGQRTLSDILAAFLHDPKIVFLDDPTIILYFSMKSKIRTLIHALNKEKNTTVILTTHDMGDVDALCRRIAIIDKGKMLYDNDIEHLKGFFGSYRTLKIRTDGDHKIQAEAIRAELPDFSVSADDEWISVLVDEDRQKVIDVLGQLQKSYDIRDMQLNEISTEEVIRKIYEEGVQ